MSSVFQIRPYHAADEDQVVALWERCGLVAPQNDPREDIRLKTSFQPGLFLVGTLGGRIAGSVMAGYDGHRGWLNYVAVLPELQGRGYGRRLVEAAVAALRELGCPKVNLQVREANTKVIGFYERLGFKNDRVVGMGLRL